MTAIVAVASFCTIGRSAWITTSASPTAETSSFASIVVVWSATIRTPLMRVGP